jgi:hypothetical protein
VKRLRFSILPRTAECLPRENRYVSTHLTQRLSFLVGIHLSDDADGINHFRNIIVSSTAVSNEPRTPR